MGRPKIAPAEVFRFAVEDWEYSYGLTVSERAQRDLLGPCWEHHSVVLRGPLRSHLKIPGLRRKIERVEVDISPKDFDPAKWREEWKAIGHVRSMRTGLLTVYVNLPLHSAHALAIALSAGKVKGADVSIHGLRHNEGQVRSFFTVDPDVPME